MASPVWKTTAGSLGHTITVDSISGTGPYSVAQVLGTVTGAELGGVCTSQQFTVTVTAVV